MRYARLRNIRGTVRAPSIPVATKGKVIDITNQCDKSHKFWFSGAEAQPVDVRTHSLTLQRGRTNVVTLVRIFRISRNHSGQPSGY